MGYGAASKLSPERWGNIKGIQKWVIDAHQTYTFVSAFCQETRLSWQNRIASRILLRLDWSLLHMRFGFSWQFHGAGSPACYNLGTHTSARGFTHVDRGQTATAPCSPATGSDRPACGKSADA